MKLKIATVQFAEDWNPTRNARIVCGYIRRARQMGADVVHFHEGALSGYCGKIREASYDWSALRGAAQAVMNAAREHRMWVVVGSAHPLTPPHKPHNCLYLISPRGELVDRYDKRFLMSAEMDCYSPGDHFATFELKGMTCGLLICFDLRFPRLYVELARRGVKVLFQSFHNGRFDGPGIHSHIMRQTVQAHAGIHALWVSAPNSSAPYSRWGSVLVTPDGKIASRLPRGRAGIMVSAVDPSQEFYDPVGPNRKLLLTGALHNGRLVRDPRSAERQLL